MFDVPFLAQQAMVRHDQCQLLLLGSTLDGSISSATCKVPRHALCWELDLTRPTLEWRFPGVGRAGKASALVLETIESAGDAAA